MPHRGHPLTESRMSNDNEKLNAMSAHEPKTDFYEATALQVIASVLGFFEYEIELVP